jgi:uncharacterized membrane protein
MASKREDGQQDQKGHGVVMDQKNGGFCVNLLSAAAILLAIGVALIPLISPKPGDGMVLEPWQEVLGNLHYLTLHIPIGIFVLVFIQELFGLFSFGKYKPSTALSLFFGVVFGVIAVLQGYLLYLQNGKSNDLIDKHMWGAIVFVALGALAFMTKIWAIRSGTKSPIYAVLLTGTMVAMVLAGHWGGESMHGDPLAPMKDAAEEKKAMAGGGEGGTAVPIVTAAPEERMVYTEVVATILDAKCYKCHSVGKKKKGKLLMDSYQALLDGGSEGPALVPGDLKESLLSVRIHIPVDDDPDDEHMPPSDKDQLSKEEIAILDWWVKSGAPQGKTLKDAGAPEAIVTAVGTLVPPEVLAKAAEAKRAADEKLKAAEAAKKAALVSEVKVLSAEFKGALTFVSQDSGDLVFSAVGLRKDFGDEGLEKLTQVGASLTELNLSGSGITDAGLVHLKAMPHLRKLRLNDTAITDGALEHLAGLPELEFLVLFGTPVSDEGVIKLGEAVALKEIFVGGTKVTEAGVKALKEKLPDLEVNTGA